MKVISCVLIWLVIQQSSAYQEDQEQMTIQAPIDDSTIAKSDDMNAINDLDSTMDTQYDEGQLDTVSEQGQTLVEQSKQPMKPVYINGWTEERVRNTKHGSRPDPSVYLTADYIKQHLEKFKYGASFLTNTKYLDSNNGRDLIGRKEGTFVMTKVEMDNVLKKAGGKLAVVEKDLGIPKDAWKDRKTSRIDVHNPMKFNPRLPNGNEPGANDLWIPGGLLPTGYSEAIIDQIPKGEYTETNIIFT